MEKQLRPYQQSIVKKVVESDKEWIICLPTGAGKTVIASAIMESIEGKCIFVVPRLELIRQAKEEFGDTDVIWSDKTEVTGKKITVASKDSLRSQIHKLLFDNEPITLIFDEAHVGIKQTHSLAETFRHKYQKVRVLGLTATPERMDGLALLKGTDSIHKYGTFDAVLQEETVNSLIDHKYLTPLKYYAKPIEGITDIRPDNQLGEELSAEQMQRIMDANGIWGDMVECYKKYGAGRPALGFTVTVAMAETVAGVFREAGYDFRVICGEMSVNERKTLIDMLAKRKIDGLVNAALLTYGFDCPPVSYAFSVRHIKSRPLWFQIVGRILRTFEGKENAVFVDHGDSISEFSEPNNPLPILSPVMDWRADGENKEQKKERKKKMKKAQETMRIIQDIAPLPADMVEITVEDTYTRLIKAIQALQKENGSLKKMAESARKENIRLAEEKEAAEQERLKAIRAAKEAEKKAIKEIDKDKTFEYIRTNYCRIRKTLYSGLDGKLAHKQTRQKLLDSEEKLSFFFDQITFDKGMKYWESHFKEE